MNRSQRAILSLSWQSAAYGIGVLGSQLIVFILVPFLTRYMPREEYGVVSILTSLYAFLNVLTNAGMPSATYRYYNDSENEKDQRITLGASQFLFFFFAALPAFFIFFFPRPIAILLLDSDQYASVLQLVAGFLIVDSMNTFGNIILRIEVRPLVASVHNVFLIACKTSLALLFVIGNDMGVFGYWLGHLSGEVAGLVLMIWLVRKRIVFQISWNRIWELTKFGFPLIPAALSMTALRLADRYIIGFLAGLDQVAVYDVGYKVGSMAILLLLGPFRIAWNPFAFSIATKPEAPNIYRNVLNYLMAICALLVLGVFAFRSELMDIMAPASYKNAASIVGWVAVSQMLLAAYWVFAIGPLHGKRTHQLAWIALASGGTNILLNFLLIPRIGILGAAIATFVSYALLATLTYQAGKRLIDLRLDWVRLGKLVLVSVSILLVTLATEYAGLKVWLEISIKAAGLASFPVLLLLVKFINPAQLKEVISLIRNKLVAKTDL
jgi:O-antigen/teichoic acid export membrane protein